MMCCVPPTEIVHHYLCCRCDRIFTARADSVDRTRLAKCPTCALGPDSWPEPDDDTEQHLRGVTW